MFGAISFFASRTGTNAGTAKENTSIAQFTRFVEPNRCVCREEPLRTQNTAEKMGGAGGPPGRVCCESSIECTAEIATVARFSKQEVDAASSADC